MKEINYTQTDEHFLSNVKQYDKAKEIEKVKKTIKRVIVLIVSNLIYWLKEICIIAVCIMFLFLGIMSFFLVIGIAVLIITGGRVILNLLI